MARLSSRVILAWKFLLELVRHSIAKQVRHISRMIYVSIISSLSYVAFVFF